jgi:nucleoside-diphosphate-sugar epimerase
MTKEQGKTVLVTGAPGFIGGFLCQRLVDEGYAVRGLAMPQEPADHIERMGCSVVRGDLTKPDTIRGVCDGVDTVYHLAARVTYWGTRKDFYDAIYGATKTLLDEASAGCPRFVYASSVVAVGLGPKHLNGYRETDPTRKVGSIFYGDAKLEAEKLLWRYHNEGKVTGTVIRPTNVIGPGSVWVRDAVDTLKRPFFPLIDGGRWSASLLYVENLADAFFLAGTKEEAKGQTYHVMDDYDVTWRQYFSDIAGFVGRPVTRTTFLSIPFGVAWPLSGVIGGAISIFGWKTSATRHNVAMMGRNNDLDTSKARRELGWKTKVSYDEAKERIRDWIIQAGLAD